MTKNQTLSLFGLLIVILFAAVWLHTGKLTPPSGADSIWFHAGLLTLLVGKYIVEYRFTRPNDVFVNCLVVFASISTLSNPPNAEWWQALRWGALACGVIAITLAWDPGREARLSENKFKSAIYQVVINLGKAEVIYSLVFILALISYFDLRSYDTRVFVIIWGAFLLAAEINLPRMAKSIIWRKKHKGRIVVALTHSFLAPSIVYCRKITASKIAPYELVGFCQTSNSECHCFGLVIGELSAATESRIVVALLKSDISEAELNERSLVVTTTDADQPRLQEIVTPEDLAKLHHIVGTVSKGTNISRVKFELFGTPAIAAGSLLSIKSKNDNVFYQVFDGVIDEEQAIRDSNRAFVEGEAEQVGCWDNERGGFETHNWVTRERSPVYLVEAENGGPSYNLKPSEMKIGQIPSSSYPVNIDLSDFVLYHTAILGVTGSGKSYLTYSIAEECDTKGIKVICIDPTGDYQKYLANAVLLPTPASVKHFLDSTSHGIGIVETASTTMHPIELTRSICETCLEWCRKNRNEDEILTPKAKVLLVLEEAHILVPEWNSNPTTSLRDKVTATSQTVLQARKYGLGFLIVTQRTANVVKTILNQCNTIISFQAFDETSFDFLKNYMGRHHVNSLPNLKARHGLIVGKASRSRRPVMVHFDEQARQLRTTPAGPMPTPSTTITEMDRTAEEAMQIETSPENDAEV